jgi:Flp pilus assembly protein TadG
MVEFAICATFALSLMLGIVEFGRALYDYHLVANAARLGARYAMVRGSDCTVSGCPTTQSAVQTYIQGLADGLDTTQLTVTSLTWAATNVCFSSPYKAAGCKVTVTVQYPFSFVAFPITPFNMTSTSIMTISQ